MSPFQPDAGQKYARPLLVGYPNVGRRDVFDQLVDEMFQRNWFTNNGNLVQRLEATLADYLEVKHCVLVCNATIGLQLVCQALELQGEVIVPAYTFVATAHAARAAGLDIVFADVLPETHLIDPKCVEQLMSSKTAAIIGVHVWGQACDVSAIGTIANNHGVRHMYDAAHAFGCRHLGTSIGNFGECEVFSFHATKFFNTFEGGAITTNNDQLAEKLRLARNFGFSGPDCVVSMGTNAKMSEVCAAMGLANFSEIPRFIETNRQHHLSYKKGLSDIKGIQLLDYAQQDRSNWQYIVIEINAEEFGVSRDELYIALHKENVFARRYFKPGVHRMEPYCSIEKKSEISLAITERLCDQILCLPNGSGIQLGDVERICGIIRAMSLRNAAQSE